MCLYFPWLPSAYKIKLNRKKLKNPGSRTFEEIRQQLSPRGQLHILFSSTFCWQYIQYRRYLKTLPSNLSEQYLPFTLTSSPPGLCVCPQSCQQPHHRNKDLKEYLVQKQSSYFSRLRRAEEFNSVTQARTTPQDCYLRAEPAQLQLF